jgi:tyrosinase
MATEARDKLVMVRRSLRWHRERPGAPSSVAEIFDGFSVEGAADRRIRKDVAKLEGSGPWFPALKWYAKAILALQARAPNDPTSWRYLAAIHGFNHKKWDKEDIITTADPMPPEADKLWSQCQHNSWYFLPWHRGYLAAFEAIIEQTIRDLGGPKYWALPYWNYLDNNNPQARKSPRGLFTGDDARRKDRQSPRRSAPREEVP